MKLSSKSPGLPVKNIIKNDRNSILFEKSRKTPFFYGKSLKITEIPSKLTISKNQICPNRELIKPVKFVIQKPSTFLTKNTTFFTNFHLKNTSKTPFFAPTVKNQSQKSPKMSQNQSKTGHRSVFRPLFYTFLHFFFKTVQKPIKNDENQ